MSGQIDVPRCRECSKVNYRIVKISRGIGIGVWIVSGAIFSAIGMAKGGFLAAAYMCVLATVVIAPIAWAVSRVVLRRTIGRNIPHEKDALKFPSVQALEEQGWFVQIFSLA